MCVQFICLDTLYSMYGRIKMILFTSLLLSFQIKQSHRSQIHLEIIKNGCNRYKTIVLHIFFRLVLLQQQQQNYNKTMNE